jgi:hypothetical protein
VDLAIVAPGATTYLQQGSASKSGVPSQCMAAIKRSKWRQSMSSTEKIGSFVPFILEATGRIGCAANTLIEKLSDFHHPLASADKAAANRKRTFKHRVNLLIAR